MTITLKSEVLTIKKIEKKTNAKMFKNLHEGSMIFMSLDVHRVGSNRGRSYAPTIKIQNIETEEYSYKTLNELGTILRCFVF